MPTRAIQRLLCDEMLAGLARWLRVAGHDVALMPPGSPDARVAAAARRDGRALVTRDRDFASPSASPSAGGLAAGLEVVSLGSDELDRQAAELTRRLGLDWLAAPFTRCLVDGAVLEGAAADDVPEAARARGGPFHRCPACRRVFWPGSHVRRMRVRLQALADAGKVG